MPKSLANITQLDNVDTTFASFKFANPGLRAP